MFLNENQPPNETLDQLRMRNIEENQNRLMQGQKQLVQSMMAMMARMVNHEIRENDAPRREDRNYKVGVESFDGTLDPKKYNGSNL